MKTTPTNQEAKQISEKLDFTSLPNYVNSIKDLTGMTNEETSTMFWILEMWNKKKFILPRYELM